MGTFKKLGEASLDDNKPIVVCGKGFGHEAARKLLDATGRDKYLIAAINQAVLFFEDVDFMFCVDVGVLVDLRDGGYDFSKVKNFVCPLHLAECERLDVKNKKIIWVGDHARLQDAKSQSDCLCLAADFFPESTNIYTYQDKMRLSSFDVDNSTYDNISIGNGYSTLHTALQWLNLTGLGDSPHSGKSARNSYLVFGTTPYSSVALGLELTSTTKPDVWFDMNFSHTLFLLQSFSTNWVVNSGNFIYKSMQDRDGYPAVGVVDLIRDTKTMYPLYNLPFAEVEKMSAAEAAKKLAPPRRQKAKTDKNFGEWMRSTAHSEQKPLD